MEAWKRNALGLSPCTARLCAQEVEIEVTGTHRSSFLLLPPQMHLDQNLEVWGPPHTLQEAPNTPLNTRLMSPRGWGLCGPRDPLRTNTEMGADPGRSPPDGLSLGARMGAYIKAGLPGSALGVGGHFSIWQIRT